MRTTSNGFSMMCSPCSENMMTIVNSRPMSARGLILGANTLSYHSLPFLRRNRYQLVTPAANGMPRKMSTLLAMSTMLMSTTRTSADGEMTGVITVMKKYASTEYITIWNSELTATSTAQYSESPSASMFHTSTIAMHLARPTRMS